jgi:FimV-like protein
MCKLILKILIFIALVPTECIAIGQTTYGPTNNADQLWQIAIFVRPSAFVSIQQTMLAILQDNPQSFTDANVNAIKPGSVLRIPALVEIQQIAPNVATQQIEMQDIAWHKLFKNDKSISNQRLVKLQTQFDSTGKALLNFDQQYQTRLAALDQYNLALQNQLQQLQKRINELYNNVVQLKKPSQFSLLLNKYAKYIQNSRFAKIEYFPMFFFVTAILLFIIWLILYWRRKKIAYQTIETNDTESEYDFMGSKEGIPAKIDLARAYIDMGYKKSAHEVINEIMAKGNTKQQSEAKKLLKQIK